MVREPGYNLYTPTHPAAAYAFTANRYLVVWGEAWHPMPIQQSIRGQVLSSTGRLVGTRFDISSDPGDSSYRQYPPWPTTGPATSTWWPGNNAILSTRAGDTTSTVWPWRVGSVGISCSPLTTIRSRTATWTSTTGCGATGYTPPCSLKGRDDGNRFRTITVFTLPSSEEGINENDRGTSTGPFTCIKQIRGGLRGHVRRSECGQQP